MINRCRSIGENVAHADHQSALMQSGGVVESGERKELNFDIGNRSSGPQLAMRSSKNGFDVLYWAPTSPLVRAPRHGFLFFSVFGTMPSASFVSAAVCFALSMASCRAARSRSPFALNFSRR